MVRTQIQLPDPLYREAKRVASQNDWSLAEVVRRGVEAVVRVYPGMKSAQGNPWKMPRPVNATLKVSDPARLRDLLLADQE